MNMQNRKRKLKSGVGEGKLPRRRSPVRGPQPPSAPTPAVPVPAWAGKLGRARGILFFVQMLVTKRFSDGTELVPAGAIGYAVNGLAWGGDEPGWFLEFGEHGAFGVKAATEGVEWCRIASEKAS